MIQNLNFYDIYGYLIPGLTFAILILLPRGLITGQWPPADWTSALVAVVVGYVVGHLVQALGRSALPSKTLDGRFPSEAYLDNDNEVFSQNLKTRLRERIKNLSGIDVRTDLNKSEVTAEVSKQRRDGFYGCRDALLTSKTISYGEQMQGMYALMDGLTLAFALGVAHVFGWALSGLGSSPLQRLVWIAALSGLVGAVVVAALGLGKTADQSENGRMTRARQMVGFLMLALPATGYVLGLGKVSNLDQRGRLGAIVLAGAFASLTCFSAYKYFTQMYAQTIYRTFSLYEKPVKAAETNKPHSDEPLG